jgi:hypothetical protein
MSIAKESLRMTGLFEAEVLVELMLRHWKHPLAKDRDFCAQVLEAAASALRSAAKDQQLLENVPAKQMNLIAAIWYVESVSLQADPQISKTQLRAREKWLQSVRRALPSCFCPEDVF